MSLESEGRTQPWAYYRRPVSADDQPPIVHGALYFFGALVLVELDDRLIIAHVEWTQRAMSWPAYQKRRGALKQARVRRRRLSRACRP